ISGPGGILKEGPGTLLLNGTNTFNGDLTVNGGSLGGNGIVMSFVSVDAAGTLSPGTSVGVLTVSNDVALAGTTLMEVSRSGATFTNDRLRNISGTLYFGGTLVVTNIGQPLVGGEVFDLFDWVAASDSFTTISLPVLSPP